nr:MAG TPA: hypothetical protein [Caudoviricetes sp.]DAX40014.1 MAG TPA: hypothetical protein [Caudoviricetes sp.]
MIISLNLIFPLHRVGAKWGHFLTLTSCALDPRALISSLKQPNLNLYIYFFNKFDCP